MEITLSRAQLVVLKELLRDGPSNATIGRRLYLSEETVKTHLRRIYAKAGIRDRTELVIAILTGKIVVNGVEHRVHTSRHEPDHRGVPGTAGSQSGVRPQP